MPIRIRALINKSTVAILGVVTTAMPFRAADDQAAKSAHTHKNHADAAPAKLVAIVRDATQRFMDVNAAVAANYKPAFGCVSGPDHGAMGVHYINGDLVGDGQIDA